MLRPWIQFFMLWPPQPYNYFVATSWRWFFCKCKHLICNPFEKVSLPSKGFSLQVENCCSIPILYGLWIIAGLSLTCTYKQICTIFIFLSLGYLAQDDVFPFSYIYMHISWCHFLNGQMCHFINFLYPFCLGTFKLFLISDNYELSSNDHDWANVSVINRMKHPSGKLPKSGIPSYEEIPHWFA